MDVFDLFAKITLDSSEYEKGLKNAKSSASGLTGLFGKVGSAASTVGKGIFNVATNVAKVSVAATTAGATAISALTGLAINSYADYEQLVGGVETLYKTSADKVQQYAADAYKTAGLSANEYMNTATTFAAALVSSLGGDTEQAAELTKEECAAVIKVMELKNRLTDMEMQSVYFRGCYDSVGYLKKAGIL